MTMATRHRAIRLTFWVGGAFVIVATGVHMVSAHWAHVMWAFGSGLIIASLVIVRAR